MPKTDSLIRTKLHLPFTRPGLVSRPRLQEQVAQGLRGPLTLVTAPAGFGKTTLVASCIAACGVPACWLSLDKDDNQEGRFLSYLVAAFQAADLRIGSEAAQLLAAAQQAPAEAVLTSLVNDLDSAGAEIALVLDDYQFINSQAVHEAVVFLLDHHPMTFHLVVATRSDPPLPLARLRARGQVVELRAADLRFTEPEAVQFLNEVMGLRLGAEAVAMLEERTEGWIAGLQMAALSMRDRKDVFGFIQGFSGTNRYILDYLLEEVLASQTPEIQHFLLHTSILERLSAPLCDALLSNDKEAQPVGEEEPPSGSLFQQESTSILEYLDRENLFLVRLDDERIWFRYHHLFADLLKARLSQAQPDLVHKLHMRASAWLEQKGFIPEAIQHLLAAQEDGRAADLIERYGPALWIENDLSVVLMADSLPPEMLTRRPKIGVYRAWQLINQGHIEKALPLLNGMEVHLAGAGVHSEQKWIHTIVQLALAFLTRWSGAPGSDPLPDYQVLDEIPASEPVMRDAADILYGMTLGRRGEDDRAVEVATRFIQREKATHGTLEIPTLVPFLATMYLFQGRLHAAASLCREYLVPIKEKGILISTAGNMDVVLGDVLYEWNYLEEAEKHIRDGLRANEPWGNIMTDAFGMLALAHVLKAKGNFAEAMEIVDKFETRLQRQSRPIEFSEEYRTLRVRIQLAGGDLQTASDWVDQILLSEDYHLHPKYYRLTLARIRLAQCRYAEVEELLSGMPYPAWGGNRIIREVEPKLLLAAAFAGQQRMLEAFELVESCLALAEPDEYVRVFLEVGAPARELLAAYLRSDAPVRKPYAQKVLDWFSPGGAGSRGSRPVGLVESLSGRELEVLQLMAQGRTNQDIARQLIVARGTVKAHTASIFRKLDVTNRTEAVARARQLGLLP